MPDLEIRLKISLQLYVLKLVSIVYLKELQLGSLLKFDLMVLRPIVWESLHIFYVKR